MVLDGKSSQEYPVNAGTPQGFIVGTTYFLLYINDLPDNVICNIAIYADDTTLYSKCDQASSLAASLAPLAHCQHVVSITLFYRYYFHRCSSEVQLAQLAPLPYSRGRSSRYSDRLHHFSVTIPGCYKDVYANSFFPGTARLWNFLPVECFPLTYHLNNFKSRINKHLLTVGSF